MSRKAAEQRGHWGEWIAALWLMLHGWRILGRRVRSRSGEIDLIARRGKIIAFIEVKTRLRAEDLATAIDTWRMRRVVAATHALAHRYARPGDSLRIDLILITPLRWPVHLPNVWHG